MRASFYERNSFKILLIAALCYGPTMVGAFRALKSNKNDVAQWLPAQYEETTTFKWFRQHFAGEQFILVSWDGCTLDDQRLRLMEAKLAPPKPAAEPAPAPTERELLAASMAVPEGELEKTAALQERPHYFKEIVTGPQLLKRLTSDPINLSDEEGLGRLKGTLIGEDGKTTCLVLTLSEEGKEHLRETVNVVRQTASQECNIEPEELHMGGAAIDNVAIDEAGERSLYKLAGFAAVIGLVVSWWCLRSPRLIVMVFFVGIYGAAASLAIVWWSPLLLGHPPGWIRMNAILLTMPSLVYVATISGAIHLSNYYKDVLSEGATLHGAPETSIRHAALPVTLATVTTAVGLLTLCYSELVPIQLFGLYSALGVVVSVLLLFFVLPACFQTWPLHVFAVHQHGQALEHVASPQPAGGLTFDIAAVRIWRQLGEGIIRRHALVSFACIAILVFCGYGLTKIRTSVHLMRLFPPDAKILHDYAWLEENLGDLVPMEVVLKIDPEKCRLDFLERMELVENVQKRLKEIPEVGGVLSAITFAPKLPRPEDYARSKGTVGALERIVVRNKYKLARRVTAKKLESHRNEYIEGDYLADEDGFELWRISARVGALKDVDYGQFLEEIPKHVEPALKAEFEEKGIPDGSVQAIYTGLVPLVYKAQRSLLDGLVLGFVSDFILITIVMMFAVRDWSAGLILALPSIFPAVVIFGLMGWLGIVVDIGTVMAPSVALGVTVDDVVHFMIQYRGGLKQGLSRRESVMLAYKGCAQAMYQSWGVIGLGLAVFAFSPFTPTQRFGYMMVTLLTSALVGNLLLLPALLAGPLGGLFGRRFTKKRPSASGKPESERATSSQLPASAGVRMHPHEPIGGEHARRGINA
ncbi:MAG TPA: MMPL family transporter [Pirellulales bacterium]|nr:MMPL family transporter [Pirellulales bacterium]